MARVRQESEETETTLRERIQRLEMSRLELEEDISRLKNSNMVEKIQHEEQLSLAKQKIQADEVGRIQVSSMYMYLGNIFLVVIKNVRNRNGYIFAMTNIKERKHLRKN